MYKKRVNNKDLNELGHALGMCQFDKIRHILDLIGGLKNVVYDLQDAREEIASLKKIAKHKENVR